MTLLVFKKGTMQREYFVYLLTNFTKTVIYTGVTNDLIRRVYEHKTKAVKGFTQRYNVDILVYYEIYDDPSDAIGREKQIKAGSRRRKVELIDGVNSKWHDLYGGLL